MNPKVRDAVQAAIDRCFQMNALCDRMMYTMKSQWNLSIFADKFHHEIAHAYPAIADDLSDILLAEDEDVTRGAVEAQMQSYAGITAMMEEYKAAALETRRIIGEAYYKAFDNAEPGAAALVADVLEDYQEGMVGQAFLLAGKIKQYNDSYAQIDKDAFVFFAEK